MARRAERLRVTELGSSSWKSRSTREAEKGGYRAKPSRCLGYSEREVSERESAETAWILTGNGCKHWRASLRHTP